ncbi:MAG: SPOR domain-containing protein [Gammaproteobacteria bacterium]
MPIRVLSLLAFFLSSAVYAENFDVQIGAFENPDVARIQLPANIGELRSTSGPNGLTRFVVGPYSSRAEADAARDRLRESGFAGAFVRATAGTRYEVSQPAPVQAVNASTESYAASEPSASQRDLDTLMSLSDEERRDLVYLDGKLHRKVGDEFIPIRE